MVFAPLRLPAGLLLPLALLAAGPLVAADLPGPAEVPTGSASPAAETAAPAAGAPQTPSAREQQVLERIRQLKTPRWRRFGVCRYDWGGWRMSEAGVRATTAECGEPPQSSGVAVHCETLRIARRRDEGPWEPWRLPLSSDESASLGGEDLMVASLCANVAPTAPAPPAAPAAPTSGAKAKPTKS